MKGPPPLRIELGRSRLAVAFVVAAYLVWRMRAAGPAVAILALAFVTLLPWLIRNEVQVGCLTLTTDARALWKANNPHTYGVLASGRWIDAVPPLPGAPPSPEQAANTGRTAGVDECAQEDLYQHQVVEFWKHHPGEKAKLAGQAVRMLWDPRATETTTNPGAGTRLDSLRKWAEVDAGTRPGVSNAESAESRRLKRENAEQVTTGPPVLQNTP